MERQIIKNHFMKKFEIIALNLFSWENLPPTIEERYIEKALFNKGLVCLVDDKNFGQIVVPCSYSQNMNIWGEPTEVITSGFNYVKTFKIENTLNTNNIIDINYGEENEIINNEIKSAIVCQNNDLYISTREILEYYVNKLVEVELSTFTNVYLQKFPFLINTTKDNEMTMKTLISKVDKGEPYIMYNKKIADLTTAVDVFNLNVPFVADKLLQYRFETEREIYTLFGFNNNFEKKERLLTDEVNSNNDFINCNIDSMYKKRKQFAELMNAKYGWNVQVKKRYEIKENEECVKEVEKDE